MWLLIGAGLALASVTALSHYRAFRSFSMHMEVPGRVLETDYSFDRGGFGMRRWAQYNEWPVLPSRPGPFTFQWKNEGGTLDLLVPIWPLPG